MDPPEVMHGAFAGSEQRIRRALGRPLRRDDLRGVHGTGSLGLAAFYALVTTERRRSDFRVGSPWPVVLDLNVGGLEALPDIDAIIEGADLFEEAGWLRKGLAESLARGQPIWQIAEYYDADFSGDDPPRNAYELLWQLNPNPVRAVLDAAQDDEGQARAILRGYVDTGRIPPDVLTHVVDQRRYLADFGVERLVSADAVKPLWEDILAQGDEEDEALKERLEEDGWQVATDDDYDLEPETVVVWQNPRWARRPPKRTQYHGTSSDLAKRAFPEIPWPEDGPFVVR
jgi:hypothetical protein